MNVPRLREIRERRVLSIRELAERSGLSHVAIVALEKGRSTARPSTIRRLAAALAVEPHVLMGVPERARTAATAA